MTSKSSNIIFRGSLAVIAITLFAKIVSFLRDMLLARYFGATSVSDVILTSTMVLLLMTTFIRSAFAAAYLPIATDAYLLGDEEKKKNFFGSVYGSALIVGVILMVLEALLLDPLINLFLPGFKGESFTILKQMMLIQLPVIPLSFLGVVNDGNLRLLNKFGLSELSNGLIASFYVIYLLLLKSNSSPLGLSVCVVVAYIVAFMISYVVVVKTGIGIKWIFKLSSLIKEMKSIFIAMIPFMLASGAKEINVFVDKAIASLLDAGSITMQSYASKMTVTEVGLIATAISLVVFSQVSKFNSLNEKAEMLNLVKTGLKFVNTLMIPCCFFTIMFKSEIIAVLFGHGEFSSENVSITANTMMIYAFGILGAGIESVLLYTMYATKHRKFPTVVSIVSIGANVVLNILLYKPFGIYGLAFASSVVALLKIPFYIVYVDKNIISFIGDASVWVNLVKVFLSSLVMLCVGVKVSDFVSSIGQSSIVCLSVSGMVSVFVLFVMFIVFKNEYAIGGLNYIKRKFNH